jgi:hypothetical protein
MAVYRTEWYSRITSNVFPFSSTVHRIQPIRILHATQKMLQLFKNFSCLYLRREFVFVCLQLHRIQYRLLTLHFKANLFSNWHLAVPISKGAQISWKKHAYSTFITLYRLIRTLSRGFIVLFLCRLKGDMFAEDGWKQLQAFPCKLLTCAAAVQTATSSTGWSQSSVNRKLTNCKCEV